MKGRRQRRRVRAAHRSRGSIKTSPVARAITAEPATSSLDKGAVKITNRPGVHLSITALLVTCIFFIWSGQFRDFKAAQQKVFEDAERINYVDFTGIMAFHDNAISAKNMRRSNRDVIAEMTHVVQSTGEGPERDNLSLFDAGTHLVGLMSLISHRYPFVGRISVGPSGEPFPLVNDGERVRFTKITSVRLWLDEMNFIIQRSYNLLERHPSKLKKVLTAADASFAQPTILAPEAKPTVFERIDFENQFARYSAGALFQDYFRGLAQAAEIASATSRSLTNFDIASRHVPKLTTIILFLCCLATTVVCGAILPMFADNPRRALSLYVPIAFYICGFTYFLALIGIYR
jgi:hypothetical protein